MTHNLTVEEQLRSEGLKLILDSFNGFPLLGVTYHGQRMWDARTFCEPSGYSRNVFFAKLSRMKQSGTLHSDNHIHLMGKLLAVYKDGVTAFEEDGTLPRGFTKKNTPSLTFFFDSGLKEFLNSSRRPAAKSLFSYIFGEPNNVEEPKDSKNPKKPNGASAGFSLEVFQKDFEGDYFNTINFEGEPVWIGREVGRHLGYGKDGGNFVDLISGKWSNEMKPGKDYAIIEGEDLARFNELLNFGAGFGPAPITKSLLILYEAGIYKALLRSEKPKGIRLRDFLSTKVLPQIRKTGRYEAPGKQLDGDSLKVIRERRLCDREVRLKEQLDFEKKSLEYKALQQVLRKFKPFSRDSKAFAETREIASVEELTGDDLTYLKPTAPRDLVTATVLGKRLGVSKQRIGIAAKELELHGNPLYSITSWDVIKQENGEIQRPRHYYTPEGAQTIEDHLRSQGHIE